MPVLGSNGISARSRLIGGFHTGPDMHQMPGPGRYDTIFVNAVRNTFYRKDHHF